MDEKVTTFEIELAISEFFDIRRHLMVPNVSWGLGLHECDMLIVTRSGYATEIEIKVNRYDLKRDHKKWHKHGSKKIKRLFFAIPTSLLEFKEYIPEQAGIIVVYDDIRSGRRCKIERPARVNKEARPLNNEQILHLGRLASMRIWSLKKSIKNKNNNYECPLTYTND